LTLAGKILAAEAAPYPYFIRELVAANGRRQYAR